MLSVYILIVVFVLGGIGFVVYLLMNDPSFQNDVESVSITDLLSDKNMEIDLSHTSAETESQFTNQSGETQKNQSIFSRFFKKKVSQNAFEDYNSASPKDGQSILSKNPFSSLKEKIPFLKKTAPQSEIEDDVMLTMRANLGLNDSHGEFLTKSAKKTVPSSSGTASLSTSPDREESEIPSKSYHQAPNPSAHQVKQDNFQVKHQAMDNEIQQKYLRLEKILKEQTEECTRLHVELKNEVSNRKNFNQVKDLLEKELADTKENFRKAQSDLKTALQENENWQKKVLVTDEKIKNLEKKLSQKEDEIHSILNKSKSNDSESLTTSDFSPIESKEDERGDSVKTTMNPLPPIKNSPQTTLPLKSEPLQHHLIEETLKDPWNVPKPAPTITSANKESSVQLTSKETENNLPQSAPPDKNTSEGKELLDPEQKNDSPQSIPGDFLSLKKDIFEITNDSEKPITLDLRKDTGNSDNPESPSGKGDHQ